MLQLSITVYSVTDPRGRWQGRPHEQQLSLDPAVHHQAVFGAQRVYCSDSAEGEDDKLPILGTHHVSPLHLALFSEHPVFQSRKEKHKTGKLLP